MKELPNYDVIVIGAGPAGCTAATLLAEKGRNVLMIEKDVFPRYHVGESLMPFCWYTLERLGLEKQMNEVGFIQKHSVQFVGQSGKVSRPFYFFQHYEHPSSTTWQVEREKFDMMLFENAVAKGVTALQGTKVKDLLRDDNGAVIGVRTVGPDGEAQDYHAQVTIDGSGRDALVASKLKWRNRDPQLGKIALWTYFKGAMRDPGLDAGSTTVAYLPDKGWFWYIPMQNDLVSVGIVAERDYLYDESRDPGEIFCREIGRNAWIKEHLAQGEQVGQYWVTGEFSYRARFCAADGLVLVGDAFAFLDPVFSSGVFLALKSGELAADAIDAALEAGDVSGERFNGYGDRVCSAIEKMRKIVYAFYDEDFNFGKLVRAHPDLRPRLTDLLIGDVFEEKFEELFQAVEEITDLPAELSYGRSASPGGAVMATDQPPSKAEAVSA